MGYLLVRGSFIALTVLGVAAGVAAFMPREAPATVGIPDHQVSASDAPGPVVNGDSLARLASERDPFRLTRRPAGTPFDPRPSEAITAPPAPGRPARPPLALAGVLFGSEPAALIDGLPGADGTAVLRQGERRGDYVVRSIGPDRVVVSGPDTTWTLVIRTRFQ